MLKPAYIMSEPHLSGHRVILGFDTLAEAQEAHAALANDALERREDKTPPQLSEPELGPQLRPLNETLSAFKVMKDHFELPEETVGLGEKLAAVIEKYEAGENHDEGAYDDECETCRILADLRLILSALPVGGRAPS